uniref:Triosephosphate isomerase n=1 Tax=candidate division WOR-3 bacterium TaxID=2052148 RepID=A0A7C1NBP7_UNCW3
MNQPLVAGNWKMHKNIRETREFLHSLIKLLRPPLPCEVAIFPPFTSLPAAAEILTDSGIALGAQNVHWEPTGAFTGEISPLFLVELGCRYCIIGHSERRLLFGETDEICNRKIKAAQSAGLRPILCCGETLEERNAHQTIEILRRQLEKGLKGITSADLDIAYEPVWAIGTGHTATPDQAAEIHNWIHLWLRSRFDDAADHIRVLYGGSVKPENAMALIRQTGVDGLLVGGASLDVNTFSIIVNSFKEGQSVFS